MNSSKEKGDMDCILTHKKPNEFLVRSLSGFFAMLIAVATILQGSPYLEILGSLLLVGLMKEWLRLNSCSLFHPFSIFIIGFTILTFYQPSLTTISIGASVVGSCFFLLSTLMNKQKIFPTFILIIGSLYICSAVLVLLYLFNQGLSQRLLFIWVLGIIWFTDSGAYFIGKCIGGPKLAPRISPKKTWSGFIGGTIVSVIASVLLAPYFSIHDTLKMNIALYVFILSISAHFGDLLESVVKRYFGVKDAGSLIPGHGGLLDRLDSLLSVSLAIGLIAWLTQ